MGNPTGTDVHASTHDALDVRRVRHHVHEPVRPPPSLLSVEPSSFMVPSNASPQKNKNACSVFSAFFRKGQVIETFRGAGIYQPAVDLAIERLRAGAWVCVPFLSQSFVRACSSPSSALKPPARVVTQIHLFAEGKVCQSDTYKADPQTGIARLQRFKWGMCASSFLSQTTEPYSDLYIILPPTQIINTSF